MVMRALLLATLLGCGGRAMPERPVENRATTPPPAPPAPTKKDALGSFTTRTRPQAVTNGAGSVAGVLTSTTGEPLIGATLVFESSVLVGERVDITGEKGTFTLDGFPAGRYRMTIYFDNQTVRRSFDVEADRVTDLVLAGWDEAFHSAPEPAFPEPAP